MFKIASNISMRSEIIRTNMVMLT